MKCDVQHCTKVKKKYGKLFFIFIFNGRKKVQKKLVHHNFEWVTPRWLDICWAALAALKANHVTTGKELNNCQADNGVTFFCRTFLRAGHQPSGAYSADVLLLLPLAIDLIYELTEMV